MGLQWIQKHLQRRHQQSEGTDSGVWENVCQYTLDGMQEKKTPKSKYYPVIVSKWCKQTLLKDVKLANKCNKNFQHRFFKFYIKKYKHYIVIASHPIKKTESKQASKQNKRLNLVVNGFNCNWPEVGRPIWV